MIIEQNQRSVPSEDDLICMKLNFSDFQSKLIKTMEVFGNVIKTNNLKLDDRQVMNCVTEHINKKPAIKDIYSGQKDKSVQDRPSVSVIEFHVNKN